MKLRDFDIVRYDGNMADGLTDGRDVVWRDMAEKPFRLSGLPFHAPGKALRRLPELAEGVIPEAVDMLAWHSSGATLGFRTDSDQICLRVKLGCSKVMDHMTAIGSGGFDLYMGPPERRIFCASTRFPANDAEYSVILIKGIPAEGVREYLLEFPLYSNVASLEIGLAPGAKLEAPTPWKSNKKVVIYGTSITQGGCASRPGMCMANMLSRRWNMEVVNLGFSGSGKGEPEVMELVASVPDPALFVLDYVVNAGLKGFRETLPGAIDIIRRRHSEVPIALLTPMHLCRELWIPQRAEDFREVCEIMRAEAERRRSSGDANVHFVNGTVESNDWFEYMVDGVHLTDLGFYKQTELVAPQLEKLL